MSLFSTIEAKFAVADAAVKAEFEKVWAEVKAEADKVVTETKVLVTADYKAILVEAHDALVHITPAYYEFKAGVTDGFDKAKAVIAKIEAAL